MIKQVAFRKTFLLLLFQLLLHNFIILQSLSRSTASAYISPNIIYKRILNIMSIEDSRLFPVPGIVQEDIQLKEKENRAERIQQQFQQQQQDLYQFQQQQQQQQQQTIIQNSPPKIPLKADSTALLIVDVQPEYWTHCPSVRKDFPKFEQNLKRTIDICRKQKAKIIWVRADYKYNHSPWLVQFDRLNGGNRPDTKSEIPCDPESEDFAWEDFATPEGDEIVIAKKSWNSASNTALMDVLKQEGIENVLVCGLITSVCVQHSAFSVFEAGYRTLLVEDSCGDRGMARHQAALTLYGNYMYEITSSKELEDENSGLQAEHPNWVTNAFFRTSNAP